MSVHIAQLFYPRDAYRSAVFAMATCLSGCPSVRL